MVDNNVNTQEGADREAVLHEVKMSLRGISITALSKACEIDRPRVRIALAYHLGAGKIEESRVSMVKLYYLI